METPPQPAGGPRLPPRAVASYLRFGIRRAPPGLFVAGAAGLGESSSATIPHRRPGPVLPLLAAVAAAAGTYLIRAHGIRTVVNLRGCCCPFDWYLAECRASAGLDVVPGGPVLLRGPPARRLRRSAAWSRSSIAASVRCCSTASAVPTAPAWRPRWPCCCCTETALRGGAAAARACATATSPCGRPANLDLLLRPVRGVAGIGKGLSTLAGRLPPLGRGRRLHRRPLPRRHRAARPAPTRSRPHAVRRPPALPQHVGASPGTCGPRGSGGIHASVHRHRSARRAPCQSARRGFRGGGAARAEHRPDPAGAGHRSARDATRLTVDMMEEQHCNFFSDGLGAPGVGV